MGSVRVGLRLLKPETVEWLRRELQRGELSRAALGRGLCEQDGWRNPRGELCAASARKALPQLASQLCLALPPAQPGPPRGRWGQHAGAARRALTEFGGSLEELGEVGLRVAETETERKLCAGLLAAGHPRGRARAPGCRQKHRRLQPAALHQRVSSRGVDDCRCPGCGWRRCDAEGERERPQQAHGSPSASQGA